MSNFWTGTQLDDTAEEWVKSRYAVERATVAVKEADDVLTAARKALAVAEGARDEAKKDLSARQKEEIQLRGAMRRELVMEQKKSRAAR